MVTDLEIELASHFGWSLFEIEETDVMAIFPFMRRMMQGSEPKTVEAFCDEVDFF